MVTSKGNNLKDSLDNLNGVIEEGGNWEFIKYNMKIEIYVTKSNQKEISELSFKKQKIKELRNLL